jgi:cytochrome c553
MQTQSVTNLVSVSLSLCLMLLAATAHGGEQAERSQLLRGATEWANNCARCHNVRRTSEFTDAQWRPVMSHMRIQAGLTGSEARDILAYLQAIND